MGALLEPIYLRGINPVLPTVFDDGLTYMEAVAKLQAKINEVCETINGLDLPTIREELVALKTYVDGVASSLRADVQYSINSNQLWVQNKVNETLDTIEQELNRQNSDIKAWVTATLDTFRKEVNLIFISPVSGDERPLSYILKQLYNRLRPNALTAYEYDNRGYTADQYDDLGATAYEYDMNGKDLSLPV